MKKVKAKVAPKGFDFMGMMDEVKPKKAVVAKKTTAKKTVKKAK